jgi:hypothetical protein
VEVLVDYDTTEYVIARKTVGCKNKIAEIYKCNIKALDRDRGEHRSHDSF